MTETSIGFGGGEVIEVGLPLREVQKLLEEALATGVFVEFEGVDGEVVIVNPAQAKVLQVAGVGAR